MKKKRKEVKKEEVKFIILTSILVLVILLMFNYFNRRTPNIKPHYIEEIYEQCKFNIVEKNISINKNKIIFDAVFNMNNSSFDLLGVKFLPYCCPNSTNWENVYNITLETNDTLHLVERIKNLKFVPNGVLLLKFKDNKNNTCYLVEVLS